jgi:hypothetical protein
MAPIGGVSPSTSLMTCARPLSCAEPFEADTALPGARSDAASTTIELPAVEDKAAAAPAADEEQSLDGATMAKQAYTDAARGRELPALDNWAAAAPAGGTTMAELAAADSEGGGILQRAAWRNQGMRFRVLARRSGSEHVFASKKAWNRPSLPRN